jgi:competence protein ComEC
VTGAALVWIAVEPARFWPTRGDGLLHVTFVDVGQGDAALVRFPEGRSLAIDAGGASPAFDIGDRVVGPVGRALGLRRIDALLLSHADNDHAGGAAAIIRDFSPREVWEGIPVPASPVRAAARQAADAAGSGWRTLQAGARWQVDGVDVVVHHPPGPEWERQRVRNDDSVVVELRWRSVSLLFAGDIGRDVEATLLPGLSVSRLRVLKVPHHGSASSSSPGFVAGLRPQVAVVSAGRGNPFGHPSPAVVRRYDDARAELFRTDRDGAVTVDTDGGSLEVSTVSGRRAQFTIRP